MLHGAGSHRWQERLRNLAALERGFEVVYVGFDGGMADILERLNAGEDPCMVADGSAPASVEVLGKLNRVPTEDRGRLVIGTGRFLDEAAEPLPCVAGEIRFAEFAVIDDVDTAIDLFLHGSRHRAANPLGIGRLVIGLPLVFCHEHLHEIRRPRQCPGVSDKNSFSAAFHSIPPSEGYWSDGVLECWSIGLWKRH